MTDEQRHAIGRVIMAMCMLEGWWQDEMRIPLPNRTLLVEREGGRWKLDERGYPIPSEALIDEVERLAEHERPARTFPCALALSKA